MLKINKHIIIFLLKLLVMINNNFAQLNFVPIKSHKVLSETVISNAVNFIYDNNLDTMGSFYSSKDQSADIEFDLGKNYLIEHVLITMKRESFIHNMSLLVGNSFKEKGRLLYLCERFDENKEIYKCVPVCRTLEIARPGIISRNILMKLFVNSNWISVYEMRIFTRKVKRSDDISSNRFIESPDCKFRLWTLTEKATVTNEATTSATDIFFEKSYIITELMIKFNNTSPKSFTILMTNNEMKTEKVTFALSDCSLQKSMFTCIISEKTFPTRHLRIVTTALTKIFIRGKTVFYPKLQISSAFNGSDKLRMTCGYSPCDLSVHSDCSEDTMKSAIRFQCDNKRLLRMPNVPDSDVYVIVNRGQVEANWRSTKFSVDSNTDDSMVVSMPRSYQYFGQYKCGCIVSDKSNTEIFSDSTQLNELAFLEELIFETKFQYKLSDDESSPYHNATNNIIMIHNYTAESSFLPSKITVFSLLQGNLINASYYTGAKELESSSVEKDNLHSVKAFDNIPQSWYVATYKYDLDEIYPEFLHGRDISIFCTSVKSKLQQLIVVKMLDQEKVMEKPAIWYTDTNSRVPKINIMYANRNAATFTYTERSCIRSRTIVLATLTDSSCVSKDDRLTCTQFTGANHLLFRQGQNFAKDMVLELIDTTTNKSIEKIETKSNTTLKQNDIALKHRLKKLTTSSTNENINVLNVEFTVISKKIEDFIPCGKVEVKITIPNEPIMKMILQQSTFSIDVNMLAPNISVVITFNIVDVPGTHVTIFQLIDPSTFGVNYVKFHEDTGLNLLWKGIDENAFDLLQYYELTTNVTTVPCNSTTTSVRSIPKSQISATKNRYMALMVATNQKHLTEMTVSVQPVYTGNKRGILTRARKLSGTIGQTAIFVHNDIHRFERQLTLIPSQSDTSCDLKDVIFNITGVNIEKFQWKSISQNNLKYKIVNLVPGRKYEVTARALYKYGPDDNTSKSYSFETSDDVSILKEKHVAELNDYVNISCTADIGPDDKFRKSVQWLRSDKSLLPDGVTSVISTHDPKIAYLIMKKASADYSGEYGCFAEPSASSGWMKISIIVNDLVVNPSKKKVDFYGESKKTKVSVTCSSSASGDINLIWISPFGNVIKDGSEKYSINKTITDQNVHKSMLTINDVSVKNSGIYKCRKAVGNIGADKEFLLYGKEQLKIERMANSSDFVGEAQRFRCTAKPGFHTQIVAWMINKKDDSMKTSLPNPLDKTVHDLEIVNSLSLTKVTCKMSPIFDTGLERNYQISLRTKIVVKGPTEVTAGTNAVLSCLGYPNKNDIQLQWMFYPKNTSGPGQVVMSSENVSKFNAHEPIKLDLNITDVENTKAGRYECKFKAEIIGRTFQPSHSINLVVNSVVIPIDFDKGAATKINFSNHQITLLIALVILFLIRH